MIARRRSRGGATGHSPWCSSRCRASDAVLGEHRSDPVTAVVGRASVVGTRVAQRDGRQHLELRISVPLAGSDDQQRAAVAGRALRAITNALRHALTA